MGAQQPVEVLVPRNQNVIIINCLETGRGAAICRSGQQVVDSTQHAGKAALVSICVGGEGLEPPTPSL